MKSDLSLVFDSLMKEFKKCTLCGKDTLPLEVVRNKRVCPICAYQLRYCFYKG